MGRIETRSHGVLVVDDEPGHRAICRLALEVDDTLACVGEAHNGRVAIERARELQPDLVVLDLRMPVLDGLASLPEIRRVAPLAGVVVWTSDDVLQREIALERGAHAVVSKFVPVAALVEALHRVAATPPDERFAYEPNTMSSGRIGTREMSTPVASRTAAAMAGVDDIDGGSPTPRTP